MNGFYSLAERRSRKDGATLLKAAQLTDSSSSRPPESAPNLAPTQAKFTDPSPMVRLANDRFFRALGEMLGSVGARSILDAGCGEGEILGRLQVTQAFGVDIDIERVSVAQGRISGGGLGVSDVHRLPFPSESFDLVLMLEVFEHVGDPQEALAEVARVSGQYLLASVPNEPWWRIGNMLRLKYLRDFGNTPEHLNHWSSGSFRRFISNSFEVIQIKRPFLWTFILAKKVAPGSH
jgi:SAM-dependent methyltransferase